MNKPNFDTIKNRLTEAFTKTVFKTLKEELDGAAILTEIQAINTSLMEDVAPSLFPLYQDWIEKSAQNSGISQEKLAEMVLCQIQNQLLLKTLEIFSEIIQEMAEMRLPCYSIEDRLAASQILANLKQVEIVLQGSPVPILDL